jgi:hypothetical protein
MILSNRETHGPASRASEFIEVIMCHPADEPPHVDHDAFIHRLECLVEDILIDDFSSGAECQAKAKQVVAALFVEITKGLVSRELK